MSQHPDNKIYKIVELLADYGQMIAHNTYKCWAHNQRLPSEISETKQILINDLVALIDEIMSSQQAFTAQIDHFKQLAEEQVKNEVKGFGPKIAYQIKHCEENLDKLVEKAFSIKLNHMHNAKFKEIDAKLADIYRILNSILNGPNTR